MSEHQTWQRSTAIRKIETEQAASNPPPLVQSIAAAARYVGAEAGEVDRWWKGRGR
jgi:NTP pyrophosphatase (non-canonical NTP hydrolase)